MECVVVRRLANLLCESEQALSGHLTRPVAELQRDQLDTCMGLHHIAALLEALATPPDHKPSGSDGNPMKG